MLLVEQKSAGRDLSKARQQALDYFPGLRDAELPRYLLLSDFRTFELHDLDEDESTAFALEDLPSHVENCGFIVGARKRTCRDQDPVNIQAAELVGKHELAEPGRPVPGLEQWLVRLVFCLFADDTGIFEPRDSFLEYVETRTSEDGGDLGAQLGNLFHVLDTPTDLRSRRLI